jgi:hypothetical protein
METSKVYNNLFKKPKKKMEEQRNKNDEQYL